MSLRSLPHQRRALIAHPFPLVVEALAVIVAAAGFTAARAGDAAATRSALAGPPVDLAVVAAGLDGLAVLRDRRAGNGATILVFDSPDPDALVAAVDLDVDGLFLTTTPLAAVTTCVDAVAGGERWLDPEATRLIFDRVARPAAPALTRRERDVAELVAAGRRNRSIADALGISEGTVKMHLHNVYAKLGLESRTQLAMELRARAA